MQWLTCELEAIWLNNLCFIWTLHWTLRTSLCNCMLQTSLTISFFRILLFCFVLVLCFSLWFWFSMFAAAMLWQSNYAILVLLVYWWIVCLYDFCVCFILSGAIEMSTWVLILWGVASFGVLQTSSRSRTRFYVSPVWTIYFSRIFLLLLRKNHQCAVRARSGVASHLSTTPRWGNPAKCFSQPHNK